MALQTKDASNKVRKRLNLKWDQVSFKLERNFRPNLTRHRMAVGWTIPHDLIQVKTQDSESESILTDSPQILIDS